MTDLRFLVPVIVVFILSFVRSFAAEPATNPLPVGWDAYRMWDHWADQRIGQRAYMRSTYDRSGGNDDASNFLFQTPDGLSVPLDLEGPGILYFSRFNHWHGSPWHYIVDRSDHVIRESTTADPNHELENATFLPEGLLPAPLAFTYQTTKGADLIWNAMPFNSSLRIGYERTHYGTGYFIFDRFVPGLALSSPLTPWDGATPPPQDVLDLIGRAGSDLLPATGLGEYHGVLSVPLRGEVTLLDLHYAAVVRGVDFSVPESEAEAFGRTRLRIVWDGRQQASVDAPIALFFGAGTLYNREKTEFLVKAFPVHIRFHEGRAELACYFPMPFFKSAHFELVGNGDAPLTDLRWRVRTAPLEERPTQVGYFHATYRDQGVPQTGKDLVLLDTRGAEGGDVWTGSFIGTSFIFSDRANLNTLEGDPRFYFDDSETPQAQGTGTEEWCGGGDYWGGRNMTLPFAGHPTGAQGPDKVKDEQDKIESAYRFLLADLMPFARRAVIHLEHGGEDDSTDHYRTVAFWYGLPAASLILTDRLQLGEIESEKSHHYISPDASPAYSITSRYEAGVDSLKGAEVYPARTDTGRKTTGTSEFTLKIDSKNLGVMLRRKLDYQYPNQRAEVSVKMGDDWQSAGIWYLAGSNTWVHSNPGAELGPAEHTVRTSDRRFRDDEFLLPRDLTAGCSSVRVRIKCAPLDQSPVPANILPAWSEIHYDAYSFVQPDFVSH